MHARFLITLAAALALATTTAAEPPKTAGSQPRPNTSARAPVILASADRVTVTPASAATPAAPKSHRAARVTTCRCGDPDPETQEEQP